MKGKLAGIIVACVLITILVIVLVIPGLAPAVDPAEFGVANLQISPVRVEPGATVIITVQIGNVGEEEGTHELELILDGAVEQSQGVTLGGGEVTTVQFTVQRDARRLYSVEIDGLVGSFEVVAPAELVVSDLTISPASVQPGEETEISARVANVGDLHGTRSLELIVEGESSTVEVSLGPGESTTIAFSLTQETEGTHEVWLDGLSGSFEVLRSATKVGGIIHSDTTWTLAESPYEITATVQIPAGVTLTIEPGVSVTGSIAGDMFLLHGRIQAHGTADRRITLDGGGDSNFFSAKGSDAQAFLSIRHAVIRDGLAFWPATGHEQYGHFHLRDSILESVVQFSYVWYPEQDVYIERNTFRNSAGFSVGHSEASVYVRWNRFESRPSLPEYMDYWVENWAAYGGQTIVKYNSFLNVGELALRLPSGYSNAAMLATRNYWGTTDTAAIANMIYDKNDDISSAGYIPYSPILAEPDPDTPGP